MRVLPTDGRWRLLERSGTALVSTTRLAGKPGRLLRLTSQDLQRLVDTQPAVKARLAATLTERLQNR